MHQVLQIFLDLAQDNVQILQPALQNRQWPTSHIRGLFDQETPSIWSVSMLMDSNLDSTILIWWISMWFNGMLVHSCFVLAVFFQEILRHLRSIVLLCYLECCFHRIEGFMHRVVQFVSSINGMTVIHTPTQFSCIHIIQFTGMVGSWQSYRGNRDIQMPWCGAYPYRLNHVQADVDMHDCKMFAWLQWLTPLPVWTYYRSLSLYPPYLLGIFLFKSKNELARPKLQTKDYKKIPVLVINDRGFAWNGIECEKRTVKHALTLGFSCTHNTWHGFTDQSIIPLIMFDNVYF